MSDGRCPHCTSTNLREKMNCMVCNDCGKNFPRPVSDEKWTLLDRIADAEANYDSLPHIKIDDSGVKKTENMTEVTPNGDKEAAHVGAIRNQIIAANETIASLEAKLNRRANFASYSEQEATILFKEQDEMISELEGWVQFWRDKFSSEHGHMAANRAEDDHLALRSNIPKPVTNAPEKVQE